MKRALVIALLAGVAALGVQLAAHFTIEPARVEAKR